jgi:hypothetical protein
MVHAYLICDYCRTLNKRIHSNKTHIGAKHSTSLLRNLSQCSVRIDVLHSSYSDSAFCVAATNSCRSAVEIALYKAVFSVAV